MAYSQHRYLKIAFINNENGIAGGERGFNRFGDADRFLKAKQIFKFLEGEICEEFFQ